MYVWSIVHYIWFNGIIKAEKIAADQGVASHFSEVTGLVDDVRGQKRRNSSVVTQDLDRSRPTFPKYLIICPRMTKSTNFPRDENFYLTNSYYFHSILPPSFPFCFNLWRSICFEINIFSSLQENQCIFLLKKPHFNVFVYI